jgi:hypothetical protein
VRQMRITFKRTQCRMARAKRSGEDSLR